MSENIHNVSAKPAKIETLEKTFDTSYIFMHYRGGATKAWEARHPPRTENHGFTRQI